MTTSPCVKHWDSSCPRPAPCCPSLSTFSTIKVPPSLRRHGLWSGQPNPVISNPPDGPAAYAGCVDLHATTAPSTPVLRSRRRRYSRTVLSVTRLISTAMPRFLSLLRPPAVYPPLRGCAPAPTLQFS